MMYPIIRNGEITGTTSKPNKTSSTPINERSDEWIAFQAAQVAKESPIKDNDPVIAELESRMPGFTMACKLRV